MSDRETSGAPSSRTRREMLGGALGGAVALGAAGSLGVSAAARAATTPPVEPTTTTTRSPALSRGRTKVIVLGSQGGQQINQLTGSNLRCGTSVLIDVGGELTVLDCGCGSVHRLAEAGYDANQVRTILITHCHADHVAELGGLAGFAWSSGRNGVDRDRRLDIYGPTGIADYEAGTKLALRRSIVDQEGPLGQRPTFDAFARWHEFTPPRRSRRLVGRAALDVRAIRVKHGAMPAVGYRVKTPDLDIAFSGDRGATGDGFAAFAKGADVLFHEAMDARLTRAVVEGQGSAATFVDHLINDHTDVADVARLAARIQVPALVLYHLIPGNPAVTDEAWAAKVRPHYTGDVVVARDLLVV